MLFENTENKSQKVEQKIYVIDSMKAFRRKISTLVNSFSYIRSSREISLAHTNIQRAFSWLGLSLEFLENSARYAGSENPASLVLEPIEDWEFLGEESIKNLENHIQKVKMFRKLLTEMMKKLVIFEFTKYIDSYKVNDPEFRRCISKSVDALTEAKFWFGWELARIKKELDEQDHNGPTESPANA